MKAICFHCRFVGIGVADCRCPSCGYPLIMNTSGAALGMRELEQVFERRTAAKPLPLPGVNVEKRQYQLLMERRLERRRALAAAQAVKLEPPAPPHTRRPSVARRVVTSLFAASAVAVGALVVLNAML